MMTCHALVIAIVPAPLYAEPGTVDVPQPASRRVPNTADDASTRCLMRLPCLIGNRSLSQGYACSGTPARTSGNA